MKALRLKPPAGSSVDEHCGPAAVQFYPTTGALRGRFNDSGQEQYRIYEFAARAAGISFAPGISQPLASGEIARRRTYGNSIPSLCEHDGSACGNTWRCRGTQHALADDAGVAKTSTTHRASRMHAASKKTMTWFMARATWHCEWRRFPQWLTMHQCVARSIFKMAWNICNEPILTCSAYATASDKSCAFWRKWQMQNCPSPRYPHDVNQVAWME